LSLNFREPRPFPDSQKGKGFNKALVVGTIKKIEREGEETPLYDDYSRKDGTLYKAFVSNILSSNNLIRIKGLNSSKRPEFAKNLAENFSEGDYVKATGSLSERYNETNEKCYREVFLWSIEEATEKDVERSAVVLQGFIKEIDYDLESEKLNVIIEVPKFNSEGYDEFRLEGDPNNKYVKWLIDKNPEKGTQIKVGCLLNNRVIYDELFGDIEEIVNNLEIVKITNFDEEIRKKEEDIDLDDLPF